MKVEKLLLSFVAFMFLSAWNVRSLEGRYLEFITAECKNRYKCTSPTRHTAFNETNCECDHLCSIFNDCCEDSLYRTSTSQVSRWTCMPFGNEPNMGAYAVNKCSRDFTGPQELQHKCQDENDISDPLFSIPVTDVSLHLTYKNRYCAECNFVPPSSLISWLVLLECKSLEYISDVADNYIWNNLKYRSDVGQWGVELNNDTNQFHSCNLIFDMPFYLRNDVRLCRANLVSTCPSTWRQLSVKKACESYMAMVYKAGNDDQAFRNPHCALCNDISADVLSCDKDISAREIKPFSFSLLLDFNLRDGNYVGMTECPKDHLYDPFFKKCRKLVCSFPGYSLVNGRCVRE
ncbi:uncharacterized protein LOC118183926 [Stegodyphus dumicola]|uniref:uncharacterized protein LOC118183926 n=1 Tax=Stegodyphus dumicola TaxID=202533 RepID=UPI0015AEC28B|nr:uncharacterized protein LOC118183926 [Stegodyphus dumicola]XP_035209431.1 uncharacterized protein LOC118183926 [Stegodyphus dumicola]